jgi:hypothetical protein
MKLLVSHPTLNQFFKKSGQWFIENKGFYKLYTSIAFPGQILYKLEAIPKLKDLNEEV